MFGHLDDPLPHPPEVRDRIAVGRKAARYRRRRRTLAISAVVVVLVATVAITSAVVGGGRNGFPGRESAFDFNQKSVVTVDTPVPTTALEDVVFVSASHGFGLADHRNHLVLASTTDGGQSWIVVASGLPLSYLGSPPAQLEFTDSRHGYLWGGATSTAPSQMLWVTDDGGSTWHPAPLSEVADVSAIDGNVWVLSQSCGSPGSPCQIVVDESNDYGVHWNTMSVGSAPNNDILELARITRSRAYVLSQGSTTGPFDGTIEYTADSGSTWSTRAVPCGASYQFGVELAASGTNDLWLICGGEGSAGNQPKQLFRSSDGGTTWRLTAQTPTAPAGVGVLSPVGYVAPYAIGHKTLDVLSPGQAWLQPARNVVSITGDGGSSWTPVTSLEAAGFGTGAPGNLTFISGADGWVCELGVGLWHTDDGVHWSPLGS